MATDVITVCPVDRYGTYVCTTVVDVVAGISEVDGNTVTDVMVVGSTPSLATVVGAMTVNEAPTEVTTDTKTVVEASCDWKPVELYTAVELYVFVTVYDTGTVMGGRVKLPVLVRPVVITVDRVTLNVVVCSGIVIVLVISMVYFAVVVNSLVKIEVTRDMVLPVAAGSMKMLILPSLLP